DLGAGLGHADDDALPPALVAALERLAHGARVANALEAVVGAAVGQLNDRVDNAVHAFRVHEVRHAELARHLLARRVDVDPDDPVRADHLRALDHVQADP